MFTLIDWAEHFGANLVLWGGLYLAVKKLLGK